MASSILCLGKIFILPFSLLLTSIITSASYILRIEVSFSTNTESRIFVSFISTYTEGYQKRLRQMRVYEMTALPHKKTCVGF